MPSVHRIACVLVHGRLPSVGLASHSSMWRQLSCPSVRPSVTLACLLCRIGWMRRETFCPPPPPLSTYNSEVPVESFYDIPVLLSRPCNSNPRPDTRWQSKQWRRHEFSFGVIAPGGLGHGTPPVGSRDVPVFADSVYGDFDCRNDQNRKFRTIHLLTLDQLGLWWNLGVGALYKNLGRVWIFGSYPLGAHPTNVA